MDDSTPDPSLPGSQNLEYEFGLLRKEVSEGNEDLAALKARIAAENARAEALLASMREGRAP